MLYFRPTEYSQSALPEKITTVHILREPGHFPHNKIIQLDFSELKQEIPVVLYQYHQTGSDEVTKLVVDITREWSNPMVVLITDTGFSILVAGRSAAHKFITTGNYDYSIGEPQTVNKP